MKKSNLAKEKELQYISFELEVRNLVEPSLKAAYILQKYSRSRNISARAIAKHFKISRKQIKHALWKLLYGWKSLSKTI